MHGLMTNLARAHEITAVSLVDEGFDEDACLREMRAYCRDVALVRNPNGTDGRAKRALQLRSLLSLRSFEHHRCAVPALQQEVDRLLRAERFDVVNVEFTYLSDLRLRQSPPGGRAPKIVVGTHELAYEIVRQVARSDVGLGRRAYAELNWRKLRRDEDAAFRGADGLSACSEADRARLLAHVPGKPVVVVPNAADVDFYRPRPEDPAVDPDTVVFFGLLSTFPNIDGVTFFLRDVWPRVAQERPRARCRIIGGRASESLRDLAAASPRVEMVGFVEDLRPHLASAGVLVVPLRLGGGTRLKICEGMAMGKAIVSTTLGAEGIDAAHERDILIADDPARFAASVVRVLDDRALAGRLGSAARTLAEERYSWRAAARSLEGFFDELVGAA